VHGNNVSVCTVKNVSAPKRKTLNKRSSITVTCSKPQLTCSNKLVLHYYYAVLVLSLFLTVQKRLVKNVFLLEDTHKTLDESSTVTVTCTKAQLTRGDKLALHISYVLLILALSVETKRSTASAVVSEIEAEPGQHRTTEFQRCYDA
jgi:hypothetical protein